MFPAALVSVCASMHIPASVRTLARCTAGWRTVYTHIEEEEERARQCCTEQNAIDGKANEGDAEECEDDAHRGAANDADNGCSEDTGAAGDDERWCVCW